MIYYYYYYYFGNVLNYYYYLWWIIIQHLCVRCISSDSKTLRLIYKNLQKLQNLQKPFYHDA